MAIIGAALGAILGMFLFCKNPHHAHDMENTLQGRKMEFPLPYYMNKEVPAAMAWQDNDQMEVKRASTLQQPNEVENTSREKRMKRLAVLAQKREHDRQKQQEQEAEHAGETVTVDGVEWTSAIDPHSGQLYWFSKTGSSWTKPESSKSSEETKKEAASLSSSSSSSSSEEEEEEEKTRHGDDTSAAEKDVAPQRLPSSRLSLSVLERTLMQHIQLPASLAWSLNLQLSLMG